MCVCVCVCGGGGCQHLSFDQTKNLAVSSKTIPGYEKVLAVPPEKDLCFKNPSRFNRCKHKKVVITVVENVVSPC